MPTVQLFTGLLGLLDRINIRKILIRVQGDPLVLASSLQVQLTPMALISRPYICEFTDMPANALPAFLNIVRDVLDSLSVPLKD